MLRGFQCALATLALVTAAFAGDLTVAAAADLAAPMQEIAAGFEKQTGTHVRLSFGSSGNFFTQIESGAPFDVFLSADSDYPRRLEADGFAVPGGARSYALGRLALWVPNGSKLDLSKGMKALLEPGVRRIAIANPRHAPYGRAAVEAMQHAGVYEQVKEKLVLGENVSQAAQFVESGNADIGIVARSLVASPGMKIRGRFVDVPAALYGLLEQGAVVVKASHDPDAARAFLDYVTGPAGKEVLGRYGFHFPEPTWVN